MKTAEMDDLLKMDVNEEKRRLQLHSSLAGELRSLLDDTSFSR